MKNHQFIKTIVEILDSYEHQYSFLSGGKTKDYLSYIKLKRTDEITLIQPKYFQISLLASSNFPLSVYIK